MVEKIGYHNQATTAGALIKTGPAGFHGVICTITGGTITVYDGTSTSGVILFSKTMTVGEFGGPPDVGIAARNGLFVVVSAGTCNVLYT